MVLERVVMEEIRMFSGFMLQELRQTHQGQSVISNPFLRNT